jgi:hypothetical protein
VRPVSGPELKPAPPYTEDFRGQPSRKSGSSLLLWGAIAVLFLAAAAGGFIWRQYSQPQEVKIAALEQPSPLPKPAPQKTEPAQPVTPEPAPAPEPVKTPEPEKLATSPTLQTQTEETAPKFAPYEETPVTVIPQVPRYALSPDLKNVQNIRQFPELPKAAKEMLVKNGFVVLPSDHTEFFPLYEGNSYEQMASFITTDSVLHNYHLMFDFLLKNLETTRLIPALQELNQAMLSEALEQYNALKGSDWEKAAQRNLGYFVVAARLLNPRVNIPEVVKQAVNQELILIGAHQEIKPSPVMNMEGGSDNLEDYSQYVPRGHYDKTEALKAYFKTMMWYGRLTFRFNNPGELKSAVLIALALNKNNNQSRWDKIYEPTTFFVGRSDDITYYQLKGLLEQIYGPGIDLKAVMEDKSKYESLLAAAQKIEPPLINSIPVFQPSLQPDREIEVKGFRFMGQRYTLDAAIFQNLICRAVGNKHGSMECGETVPDSRLLPKGLDIPAAMGSQEALSILQEMGETDYKNYPENIKRIREVIAGLKPETWKQNLYWGWLYSLMPLTTPKGEGYPVFMQGSAWARKDLNTYLGSWTELKHDTILYAKQVYAEMGGGDEEKFDDRGYVEPNSPLYARLAALVKMTRKGLTERNLLSQENAGTLQKMEELIAILLTISEKELGNIPRTAAEYDFIRSYGGQLEHFWIAAFKALTTDQVDPAAKLDREPAALIADVATAPPGTVLEEATGYINEILVVVPMEGKLTLAKGGVYSYYEFTQPLAQRLTDGQWRQMLADKQTPPLPPWTSSFMMPVSLGQLRNEAYNDHPWLSQRLATEDDLRNMSSEKLDRMRNEIYARHGWLFSRKEFQDYFGGKSWYQPKAPIPTREAANRQVDKELNPIERKNIQIIKNYQQKLTKP